MRLLILLLGAVLAWGAEPQRIISTAPSITETLFAMGLGPKVVGVTVYCAYPPEVLKLPKIGTFLKPNIESMVDLHPDLVVVQRQGNRLGEQLDLLHIRHVDVQSENLDFIYKGALAIGEATGRQSAAAALIARIKSELNAVATNAVRSPHKLSVLVLVGHNPGKLEGLIAGAGGSYFADLLNTAGATNAFSDSKAPYPKISIEEILARDPDFILELSGDALPKQQEAVALWQNLPLLRAVRNHHVFAIPAAPFVVPGPRAPQAARLLFNLLHPEAHSAP